MTKSLTYDRVEGIVHAYGNNWEYKQVGTISSFTQSGKLPSLRVIKTLLRLLNKVTEEK